MPVNYHYGKFPPKNLDWERLASSTEDALIALIKYDSLLSIIKDSDALLSPLITQEAVLSSRIEGTRATMGEVLEFEAGGSKLNPSKQEDATEILNYRRAMIHSTHLIDDLPISGRFLRDIHEILLTGSRGHFKSPGKFRLDQNWIGVRGSSIKTARFIPIDPDQLQAGIHNWEKFVNSNEGGNRLIKIAISHAEFESLHPFNDGNGRVGRILIPLMMWKSQLIKAPNFYISDFFEVHRDDYLDKLLDVSENDDWTGWCEFFLMAVKEQADSNFSKAHSIYKLHEKLNQEFLSATKSEYSIAAINAIFSSPIFNTPRFIRDSGIPPETARRLIRFLASIGIIRQIQGAKGRKPAVYIFPELINIAEGANFL